MLFEIHSEGKISYKRLSDADLKRNDTSHQTHIGLSNDSLTFMQDNKKEYASMLIYDDYCDIVKCEVGKILRRSGRYDAPNLKTGGRDENSAVRKIREFATHYPHLDFYLIWFGLDSGTPVFWLVREGSIDYISLNKYCYFDQLRDRNIKVLDESLLTFYPILTYARQKLERVSVNLQKDLELAVEMETDNPKFKDSDVRKAQNYIREIGRAGEEMINEYLSHEKSCGRVSAYEWCNKSHEVGKPYDFWIKYAHGQEQWIDVKTTEHEFEQAVIISKNEIRFITEKKDIEYAIFRVYSKEETAAHLRICSHCLRYIKKLQRDINYMTQSLSDYKAAIINFKISFEPGPHCFNYISEELFLGSRVNYMHLDTPTTGLVADVESKYNS